MTSDARPVTSIRLTPTAPANAGIDALADAHGGRRGLAEVLHDLSRHGRRGFAPGRAVRHAVTWDRADRHDPTWWPQGISSSADSSPSERVHGLRLLAVSWYSKAGLGSRISFLDPDTRRYQHVRLGRARSADGGGPASLAPLKAHAGGLVWHGPWLYVAATARGIHVAHVDDVIRVDGEWVLPVRFTYAASAEDPDEPLRFSFLSLDRTEPVSLLVGEYGRTGQSTRLARFPLDPSTHLLAGAEDGVSRPAWIDPNGPLQAQGAVVARGRLHLTMSQGRRRPGSVYAGSLGSLRRRRYAAPVGPEDLTYWPSTDLLWSLTEHPPWRWVFAMPRRWYD